MAAYTAIDNPELYFQTKLYTGNGSSQSISLDGSENEQVNKIRIFGNELQSYFSAPIEYWDERYSSDVIFKEMRKSDFSTTKIKKKLDQQSAAYILQGYLDKYRNTI